MPMPEHRNKRDPENDADDDQARQQDADAFPGVRVGAAALV